MKKIISTIVLLAVALATQATTYLPITYTITPSLQVSTCGAGGTNIAPCAVFLDASGTVAPALTAYPFHEIQYSFNAGDGNAGTWANGTQATKSNNVFTGGPMFAHVYETAGTYTPCVTTTYNTITATTCASPITITSADSYYSTTNTTCVSTSGTFTGCPSGANQVTSGSFTSTVVIASNQRTLYRCGETFSITGTTNVFTNNATVSGGTIGGYGTCGRVNLQWNNGSNTYALSLLQGTANTVTSDWRFINLSFDANGSTTNTIVNGQSFGIQSRLLFLRVDSTGGWVQAVNMQTHNSTPPDMIFYVGGNYNGIENENFFGWGTHFVAMDNYNVNYTGPVAAGNPLNELRWNGVQKGFASENTFAANTGTQTTQGTIMTFRVSEFNIGYGVTNAGQIVVADNVITAASNMLYGISVQISNGITDDGIATPVDLIFERNWITQGSTGGQCYNMDLGNRVTVRNNLCDISSSASNLIPLQIRSNTGGCTTTCISSNVWVYNNSIYGSNTASNIPAVTTGSNMTNINLVNNAAYFPNSTGTPVFLNNTGGGSITSTTNSSNAQVKSNTPGWTLPPSTSADWTPGGGSYAIGGGSTIPVWSDYFLTVEPSPRDIGAVNH